eukprot:gene5368-10728_t
MTRPQIIAILVFFFATEIYCTECICTGRTLIISPGPNNELAKRAVCLRLQGDGAMAGIRKCQGGNKIRDITYNANYTNMLEYIQHPEYDSLRSIAISPGNESYSAIHLRLEDDFLSHLYVYGLRALNITSHNMTRPDFNYLILDDFLNYLEIYIPSSNINSTSTSKSKELKTRIDVVHISTGLGKYGWGIPRTQTFNFVIEILQKKYTKIGMFDYSYVDKFLRKNSSIFDMSILRERGRDIRAIPDYIMASQASSFVGFCLSTFSMAVVEDYANTNTSNRSSSSSSGGRHTCYAPNYTAMFSTTPEDVNRIKLKFN